MTLDKGRKIGTQKVNDQCILKNYELVEPFIYINCDSIIHLRCLTHPDQE
jgi:hypothetical protein